MPNHNNSGNSFASAADWVTGKGAALIALGGFMVVSIIATAMGFADLRMANADTTELKLFEMVPIILLTIFVVLAMVASLNTVLGVGLETSENGKPKRHPLLRVISLLFYAFFAFWSVGFGYGFYWKELAGQEYTQNQFKLAIEEVGNSVDLATNALATVEVAMGDSAVTARTRAQEEADNGKTCSNQPNSIPGDGPLTRARFAFADRTETLQQEVTQNWTQQLVSDRARLARRVSALSTGEAPVVDGLVRQEAELLGLLAIASDLSSADRRSLFATVFDDARAFTTKANGLRQRNAEAIANRLDNLAAEVGPDPQSPGRPNPARQGDVSYCWDTVLNEKLQAASQSLRSLENIPSPEFEFTEGPKATRAAFFDLARIVTFNQDMASEKFGEKNWIALFASIAVDAGIFFLTLARANMERKQIRAKARKPKFIMDLNALRNVAHQDEATDDVDEALARKKEEEEVGFDLNIAESTGNPALNTLVKRLSEMDDTNSITAEFEDIEPSSHDPSKPTKGDLRMKRTDPED